MKKPYITKYSKRLFYKKYLFKAVIMLPKARIVNEPGTVAECISVRYNRRKCKLASLPLSLSEFRATEFISEERLQYYRAVKEQNDIKIRIEEPYLNIYSNNKQELVDIIKYDPALSYAEIHMPANDAEKEIIQRGELIVSSKLEGFNYKVELREGYLDDAIKNYLLNLQQSNPGEIRIPHHLRVKLRSAGRSWIRGYFYINDLSLLTFINLVDPKAVTSFFKLTVSS